MSVSPNDKVVTMAALEKAVRGLKRDGKRVVHTRGTFDLLQPNHVRRLEAARREGDVLAVTIRSDEQLGDARPTLDQTLRARILAALTCVDYVAIEEERSADDTIKLLDPDVCVPGADGDPPPKPAGEDGSPFSAEGRAFLRDFASKYTADQVIDHLKSLKKMKVLVVGDTIIDEYHFVRPFGMPLKSPIIASQFLEGESHAGGILAVANHVAGFCGEVHLVTGLGATDSREDFITRHLRSNITSKFIVRPDAPTTVKRRYLRKFLVQKLFEVSFFNDAPLPPELDQQVCQHLSDIVGNYDMVVVADFGQGFISPKAIDVLCRSGTFLAVNAQMNSINLGYHIITRYPRADYVCIDEDELRLALRDRYSPVEQLLRRLGTEMKSNMLTVTRGHHGSLTFQAKKGMCAVPVLSREVVDTIGAGDAYLSVTAPCVRAGFPPPLIGFIGNAVGALAVKILGNQQPVGQEMLFESVKQLLR